MSQRASPENSEEYGDSELRAAPGAAVEPPEGPIDPELLAVVQAWAELPDAVRAGVVAIVRATRETTV